MNIEGGNFMGLLAFLLIFIISNIILLKWAQKLLNESPKVHYPPSLYYNGRKFIGNSQLEKIRKKVNSKKSKI